MKCLIVGGTGFLGGAMADALSAAGHETTILSRGKNKRAQTGKLETLCADRHEDLSVIKGREFDWIFDSCAYTPAAVHNLLDAAGPGLKRYVLVSSISVYGTFEKHHLTENDPAPDATSEELKLASEVPASDRTSAAAYGASYGPLKRACEIAAMERLGNCTTALRVGLLVGAGDYTDRLTWWIRRIDQAIGDRQQIPVPGPSDRYVQLIDVRDVAAFALGCAENARGGLWNVTSPPIPLTNVLNEAIRISQSQAELVMFDEQAVAKHDIQPWTEIPLMPPVNTKFRYFLEVDTTRAFTAGLHCRPLDKTLHQLLLWDRDRRDITLSGGMTSEQERLLLAECS